MRPHRLHPAVLLLAGAMIAAGAPAAVGAQLPAAIPVELPNGERITVPVVRHRNYAAFSAQALEPLGWSVASSGGRADASLRHPVGLDILLVSGSPFIRWNGELVQLVHPPYWFGDTLHLPIQLLVDVFPAGLPEGYRFDEERYVVQVSGIFAPGGPAPSPEGDPPAGAAPVVAPAPVREGAPTTAAWASTGAPRVVIIDPGHGGSDPGATSPGGVREKDVALAMALALARELSRDPSIEVRLTRDRDVGVPIWSRGEWATQWKGDRPGIFISLHANALDDRSGVRGFETYFLSEARDEHERRVAALENASLAAGGPGVLAAGGPQDPLVSAILRDLQAFDHQHWSADLARQVQEDLGRFHPGTDRGVKQGPLAVITNSLMPSVLVEVGFLTNPEEERLLSRPEFHRDAAQALARAVHTFFQRYPPGQGG